MEWVNFVRITFWVFVFFVRSERMIDVLILFILHFSFSTSVLCLLISNYISLLQEGGEKKERAK